MGAASAKCPIGHPGLFLGAGLAERAQAFDCLYSPSLLPEGHQQLRASPQGPEVAGVASGQPLLQASVKAQKHRGDHGEGGI